MQDEALAPAPIWSDVTTFDARPWRGVVDIVLAGIPCQGNSLAGKRLLGDDPRNLWPQTRRILREVESEWFFLENVYGFLVPGGGREAPIARVLGDLSEDGWNAEWGVFSAAGVGAPHERKRVFVLAHRQNDNGRRGVGGAEAGTRPDGIGRRGFASDGPELANPEDPGRREYVERPRPQGGTAAGRASEELGHAESEPCGQRRSEHEGLGGTATTVQSSPELADAARHGGQRQDGETRSGRRVRGDGDSVADARGVLAEDQQKRGWQGSLNLACRSGRELADAECGVDRQSERGEPHERGWDTDCRLPLFPPGPSDLDGWRRVLAVEPGLAPAVSHTKSAGFLRTSEREDKAQDSGGWRGPDAAHAGRAAPEASQPSVRVMADGLSPRLDQLRALGNAVVPLVAAQALRTLGARFEERLEMMEAA